MEWKAYLTDFILDDWAAICCIFTLHSLELRLVNFRLLLVLTLTLFSCSILLFSLFLDLQLQLLFTLLTALLSGSLLTYFFLLIILEEHVHHRKGRLALVRLLMVTTATWLGSLGA